MDILSARYQNDGETVLVKLDSGRSIAVPAKADNYISESLEDWLAKGGRIDAPAAEPDPAPLTVEEEIEKLPPLWRAALDAYIEQQPRSKRSIINNIKRHLK